MKQTVEEAAMNFANYESNNLDKLPFKVKVLVDYDNGLTRGFKAGAKWQANQSQCIRAENEDSKPKKTGKESPNTIYLQFYGDGDVDNAGEISHENVTWCEDRIYPTDVEYTKVKSPWISVEERLPEQNELVLCRMVSNGAIVSGYIFIEDKKPPRVATQGSFEFEDWNDYECDMWMSIPSFDDILKANKDVLERIKEKGD